MTEPEQQQSETPPPERPTVIEKTGRTADGAVEAALRELGASREEVEVEVLGEESRGLLGILGHSQTRVRVTLKAPPPRGAIGQQALELLQQVLEAMETDVEAKLVSENEEEVVLDLQGENLGVLIGKHGQTLGALQHLVNIITNRRLPQDERKRIIVDAEGYRAKRESSLTGMAKRAARTARETGREVTLDALAANERRIIHMALADEPGVTTRSVGTDPSRRVVVVPTARRGRPGDAGERREAGQPWGPSRESQGPQRTPEYGAGQDRPSGQPSPTEEEESQPGSE
jgi:spoIIIJ-associated protein